MGEKTGIQWTDHTWNPWHGCRKVSQGCKFCYMYRDKARYGQDPTVVVRSTPSTFRAPLSKRWLAGERVFACSWSDWWIEEADAWRDDAWEVIRRRPDLTFQLLTKRPGRILSRLLPSDWGDGWPNVWLGVSVESNATWAQRVPLLQEVPARVRFLSMEPLLERVEFKPHEAAGIGWVIVGGESGPSARECRWPWLMQVIRDCKAAGIPCFVKQAGTNMEETQAPDGRMVGLRHPHGGDPAEWGPAYRVREFPTP